MQGDPMPGSNVNYGVGISSMCSAQYYHFSTEFPIINVQNDPKPISSFKLEQNYPNPFNPRTKISWQSPIGSWQTLKVYDMLGREVATLVDEYKPAGSYEVEFDASALSSGVYFYKIQAREFISVRKMVLQK